MTTTATAAIAMRPGTIQVAGPEASGTSAPEQQRAQVVGGVGGRDRARLLLGGPESPAREDHGHAVLGGAVDVVVAVADEHGARRVDAALAQVSERAAEDRGL